MSELENFYNEHATQARQHEDHRERMTNLLITINGALIALICFGKLTMWSLWPSVAIIILGFYGFYFAGKHYERWRYHSAIMSAIRNEIDRLYLNPAAPKKSLQDLKSEGTVNHYRDFRWPDFKIKRNTGAFSWIARQRVHVFWETIHILLAVIGLGLTVTIIIVENDKKNEPTEIRLVK